MPERNKRKEKGQDDTGAAENRREGSGKWEGIIINGIVSIVVAITVIVIAYVISGGHITS